MSAGTHDLGGGRNRQDRLGRQSVIALLWVAVAALVALWVIVG